VSVDQRVQPSESTPYLLNCISNSMRRLMILSLAGHEQLSFSQLMRLCGLSPRYDTTGTFVYHLSQLTRIGVVSKVGDAYSLTPVGKRVHRIVGLLERESRFLDKRERMVGAKIKAEGGVLVRPALAEDNPAVAELVASEYFEEASRRYAVPWDYYERRKRETDLTLGVSGRNLVFLAQRGGEAVGVCWWMLIEREAVGGSVNKEAFLEHLYIRPGSDHAAIAERLMKASIQILQDNEKTTILNVFHSKDEPFGKEFYAKFDITESDIQLLMHVAQWARPPWRPRESKNRQLPKDHLPSSA